MNKTSLALQAHIASELTTLATCYKITRKDKQLIGFTDHVDDLIYANLTYHNASGFSASALTTHASLAVDHMEVEAVFSHPLITSEDILSGRYDHAELEVFRVNYQDLAQGQLYVKRGWLGEVRLSGGKFSAEIRSLAAALTNSTAQLVSATCQPITLLCLCPTPPSLALLASDGPTAESCCR